MKQRGKRRREHSRGRSSLVGEAIWVSLDLKDQHWWPFGGCMWQTQRRPERREEDNNPLGPSSVHSALTTSSCSSGLRYKTRSKCSARIIIIIIIREVLLGTPVCTKYLVWVRCLLSFDIQSVTVYRPITIPFTVTKDTIVVQVDCRGWECDAWTPKCRFLL